MFSVFLSMLLVGTVLWWWRGQFLVRRPLMEQSFSLKESQDPLLLLEPPVGPNTCQRKAREAFTHQFIPVCCRMKPFWFFQWRNLEIENHKCEIIYVKNQCDAPFHCGDRGWKIFLWVLTGAPFPFLLCRIRQQPVDKC